MTKKEFIEWVDQIPDDIFEAMYALDPGTSIQVRFTEKLASNHLAGKTTVFDDSGFMRFGMPFGELVVTP